VSAWDYLTSRNIPYVVFYHCISLGGLGVEDGSFALPDFIRGTPLESQSSFWGRLSRFFSFVKLVMKMSAVTDKLNKSRRRHGFATYNAPETNIAGHPVIAPTSWGFEYSRRISPLVHLVGFIADKDDAVATSPLTKNDGDIKEWLDASITPTQYMADPASFVVYASFGTEMLPTTHLLKSLIKGTLAVNGSRLLLAARSKALAAADINLTRLVESMDTNETEAAKDSKRIRHVDWVRQPMVLSHPSTKEFVTHGGAASLAEGVSSMVPMIVVPSGGDRYANAARLVEKVHCVSLHMHTLMADDAAAAIEELRDNATVINSLKRLGRINDHAGGGSVEAARPLQHIFGRWI